MKLYAQLYKEELLNKVMPFWVNHSPDKVNGGFFTCLDQYGNVFDTDKFVWLQGRQVWTMSTLYHQLEQNPAWLKLALSGAAFLEKHGRDEHGRWYFSLTESGAPLIQPYNIFSDCFAVMAFAALNRIAPADRYKRIVTDTFHSILQRQDNWKGIYNKTFPGTRPLRNFSLPMILCNLSLEVENIIGENQVVHLVPNVIDDILSSFYRPEHGIILENVTIDGAFSNSFEGRLVNPGHGIEAMWFVLDWAHRTQDMSLARKASAIIFQTLDYSWDKEYGGIYYFLDVLGHPTQQLEWDQKLWWVHVEALVALAKVYQLTNDARAATWFARVHEYTWTHFRDEQYPEWFGYLNRQGHPLFTLKGGKWKGCFHIPRALFQVWKTLSEVGEEVPERPTDVRKVKV